MASQEGQEQDASCRSTSSSASEPGTGLGALSPSPSTSTANPTPIAVAICGGAEAEAGPPQPLEIYRIPIRDIGRGCPVRPRPVLHIAADPYELWEMFECSICSDLIIPPIKICEEGHSCCTTCRARLHRCPFCRCDFTEIRNRWLEQLFSKSVVSCTFWDSGCPEVLPGKEMAAHVELCNYRSLHCWECRKEIPFADYISHLEKDEHLQPQQASECVTGFEFGVELRQPLLNFDKKAEWSPFWTHVFDTDFFCYFRAFNNTWMVWVAAYGPPPPKCKDFIYTVCIWNRKNKTERKYTGPVHSIRSSPKDIWHSGDCLTLQDNQLSQLIYKKGIDVYVRIEKDYEPPKAEQGSKFVESPADDHDNDNPEGKDSDDEESDKDD